MGLVDLTKTEVKRILRDLQAPYIYERKEVRKYRRLVKKLVASARQTRL